MMLTNAMVTAPKKLYQKLTANDFDNTKFESSDKATYGKYWTKTWYGNDVCDNIFGSIADKVGNTDAPSQKKEVSALHITEQHAQQYVSCSHQH